jgi:hypothetical protein
MSMFAHLKMVWQHRRHARHRVPFAASADGAVEHLQVGLDVLRELAVSEDLVQLGLFDCLHAVARFHVGHLGQFDFDACPRPVLVQS